MQFFINLTVFNHANEYKNVVNWIFRNEKQYRNEETDNISECLPLFMTYIGHLFKTFKVIKSAKVLALFEKFSVDYW